MSNVREQNDWAEFREHLNREMDRQSTLLWGGMALLLALNIATLCLAIGAEFKIHTLKKDIENIVTDQVKLSTKQVVLQDELLRVIGR